MNKLNIYKNLLLLLLSALYVKSFNRGIISFSLSFIIAYTFFERDFHLPFLGPTVFPDSLIKRNKYPQNWDTSKKIKVSPNTLIVYWASVPKVNGDTTLKYPWDAYQNYSNAGTIMSDDKGYALLKFKNPQEYLKPFYNTIIKKHVHYRYKLKNGMYSRVYTAYL